MNETKHLRKINKKKYFLFKIILILSCPFLTLLLSNRFDPMYTLIGCLMSIGIAIPIIYKSKIESTISTKMFLFYLFTSCYFIRYLFPYAEQNVITVNKILYKIFHKTINPEIVLPIIGILAIPSIIYIIHIFHKYVTPKVIDFFKNLTKVEKIFLYIITIIASIISITIIYNTSAFSKPIYNNNIVNYDVIYTSDSGSLLKWDAYLNISHAENDIRQPLFGVFALPFGLLARFISEFCFFCKTGYEYETIMTILQFMITAISIIMISRLLKIEEKKKWLFFLFCTCSFPYLFFSILLEQYAIGLFYLILAIYYYFKNPKRTNYLYIGAVGTLITSGIIFPFITKFQNVKQWIKTVFKCFLVFIGITIISGQIIQLFYLSERINVLFGSYATGISFKSKLFQYTAFIKGLFVANNGHLVYHTGIPGYEMLNYNSINWIGISILLLCILSFILNKKNKMALLSMLWIVFSVLILFIVGWGTMENGLVLYSLYFYWAFYSLIFLLIYRLCKNRKIFTILICILVLLITIKNINELNNIFNFATQYYK